MNRLLRILILFLGAMSFLVAALPFFSIAADDTNTSTASASPSPQNRISQDTHLVVLPTGYAEDLNSSSNKNASEMPAGYEISKDNYLNVPSDMKIRKVANNVITTEPDVTYLARKFEEQNKRLEEISQKLHDMDERMKNLEDKN